MTKLNNCALKLLESKFNTLPEYLADLVKNFELKMKKRLLHIVPFVKAILFLCACVEH